MDNGLNLEGYVIVYPGTGPIQDGAKAHNCIILKDDTENGDIYIVPICSFHDGADKTLLLDQQTPALSLKRKSYLAYYAGKKVSRKATFIKIHSGELKHFGPIPRDLFDKMIAGVRESDETEPWFAKAF